jgi:hypothetical protein
MLIDPDAFEACFSAWAQSFAEAFDREVVAIDGKTLRRSFGRAQGPLHLVSASEQGLALGQREVDGKSNEITAIPALLETLSLNNGIVTLDAMGCQKAIAGQILDRGADRGDALRVLILFTRTRCQSTDYPGLGFPGSKPVTAIRNFPGTRTFVVSCVAPATESVLSFSLDT